ncbi:MAG: hypothetical protein AAGD18_16030 [Actinomycetota bacterium]
MTRPSAPIVDPLLDDVVAEALLRRGHRPARIAVVGRGGRPLARQLCERHPDATVVSAATEDDHPTVRLVADGPFDLVVACPLALRPSETLAVCRASLVDRGLAIALVDLDDDRLAAAAAVAGFDVETHHLNDRRVLVAMRP